MKKLYYIHIFILLLVIFGCSRDVEIPRSDQPPVVTLSADSVAIANGKYIITAEAKSAYGGAQLRKVDLYKNDEKIGERNIAPYVFEYEVEEIIPDQELSFYVLLTDHAGNSIKSNVVKPRVRVLPIRIEAENSILKGVARVAADQETRETSSNQAKVGAIDNAESGIDVMVNILARGEYLLTVAAGTGFDGTSHKIYIDDNKEDSKIYEIPNKGWNMWQRFDMVFHLEEGTRKISIRHNQAFGEIDYLEYSKL